jgi:hypothetical protein
VPLSTRIPICRSMRSSTSRGDKFTGRAGSSQGSSVHQIFLTEVPMTATPTKHCVYRHHHWMFRKYDLNFFTSFVDIFNPAVIPNMAQITHHRSKHVYFYIVYCVHYYEVKKFYVTLTSMLAVWVSRQLDAHSVETTNKLQPCNRIYYSTVH